MSKIFKDRHPSWCLVHGNKMISLFIAMSCLILFSFAGPLSYKSQNGPINGEGFKAKVSPQIT